MEEGIPNYCIKSCGGYGGYGGGSGGGGGGIKCGRWNPTTEQLRVLSDLFRSGLRTPNTDQIQKISNQLSFYGKIESKNVFYWFQNHKARERQKRRRVTVVDDEHEHKENIWEDKKLESSLLCTHFPKKKEGGDEEKVKETLQLFPLSSFNELESSQKMRFFTVDQTKGTDGMHPTLDLRLSFL